MQFAFLNYGIIQHDTSPSQKTEQIHKKGTHFARGKYFVKWDYYTCKPALLPAARDNNAAGVCIVYAEVHHQKAK